MALALPLALVLSASTGLDFIEDDFQRALKTAKAQKKLLFVDAWAPWCHTCAYMREHVLTRPGFKAFEADLVFASVDTEKRKSEAFLAKYPVSVWPTLFVIDPATGAVRFVWAGSADEVQLGALLEAAKANRLAKGDEAIASGDAAAAAARYLEAKPKPGDGAGAASMLYALFAAGQHGVCAQQAVEALPGLTRAQDTVAVLGWGLTCALRLAPSDPARAEHLPKLVKAATAALTLEGAFVDDVSALYESLVEEREAAKDDAGGRRLAAEWLAMLERAAAQAPTPKARATYDAHRLGAALALGQPARVVDALALSEAQLPEDFNPPARLAVAYRELGMIDLATRAIDRALAKNKEGPRRVCLFRTKASVRQRANDLEGQRAAAAEGLRFAKTLPASKVLKNCSGGLDALAEGR